MLPLDASLNAHKQEIDVVPWDFREEPKKLQDGSYEMVHKVTLVKKGTTNSGTPFTIKELKQNQILWPVVEPFYDAWLKGQEEPVDGTPIDVLPFLDKHLVGHLKLMHIKTVEDLASSTDTTLQHIGMGARRIKEKAQAFLDAQASGDLADKYINLKEKSDIQQQQIEELQALVNELTPPEKKRGRPKKDSE